MQINRIGNSMPVVNNQRTVMNNQGTKNSQEPSFGFTFSELKINDAKRANSIRQWLKAVQKSFEEFPDVISMYIDELPLIESDLNKSTDIVRTTNHTTGVTNSMLANFDSQPFNVKVISSVLEPGDWIKFLIEDGHYVKTDPETLNVKPHLVGTLESIYPDVAPEKIEISKDSDYAELIKKCQAFWQKVQTSKPQ